MNANLITEGSDLIAKFMGYTITPITDISTYYYQWNNLMPVIDKIEDLDHSQDHYQWQDLDGFERTNFQGYEVDISYRECRIWLNLELDPPQLIAYGKRSKTKFESVFRCVVLFIKWYNKNKLRVGGN